MARCGRRPDSILHGPPAQGDPAMSIVPPSAKAPPPPPLLTEQREIRIYSHSQLFYWWPVWAIAFILTLWTWLAGTRMIIVPAATTVEKAENGKGFIVKAPSGTRSLEMAQEQSAEGQHLHVHATDNSRLG